MDPVDPAVERYAIERTSGPDATVAALRSETQATMADAIMAGGLVEVKLLEAFVVATGARRVLEIGTFTGVGALSMAARLGEDGTLVTLEADPTHATVARRHIEQSPFADRIQLIEGDALSVIPTLDGPFDVVFVDAWKTDYPAYFELVLPKLADHGVIVCDNMLQDGRVLDPPPDDAGATALRAFADQVHADPRVDSAFLTVADGLLVIWKR
jgi:caffeoyl-CoA O-methyltransferase